MNTNLILPPETNGVTPEITASNSIEWMFNTMQPFITGRTLEISSGTSPFHPLFIESERPLHLSDADQNCVTELREKYKANRMIRAVHTLDFYNLDLQQIDARLPIAFDCIFNLCNDMSGRSNRPIIANARELLKDRGRLIIFTSVHISLFTKPSQYDLKKVNLSSIQSMLGNGFEVITAKYFSLKEGTGASHPAQTGLSAIVIARKI